MRLDLYLVEHFGLASRSRARALIKEGKVTVNGRVVEKAGAMVLSNDDVDLITPDHPYVSRAALKLRHLVETAKVSLEKEIVLDIGSSTGGFTQVALECGADHVYAVDVGTAQLHGSLRHHADITLMEQTDARALLPEKFSRQPTVLMADVSFISLSKVLQALLPNLTNLSCLLLLIKPQFELSPEQVGKKGIVHDEADHKLAIKKVENCVQSYGFSVKCDIPSPVKGSGGNQEYLMVAVKQNDG